MRSVVVVSLENEDQLSSVNQNGKGQNSDQGEIKVSVILKVRQVYCQASFWWVFSFPQLLYSMLTNYFNFKELLRLDPGIDQILRPVSVSGRYDILTDSQRMKMLTCKVGDTIEIRGRDAARWDGKFGIVRYVGPICRPKKADIRENLTWADRLQGNSFQISSTESSYIGIWFGIELIAVSLSRKQPM